MNSSPVSLGEEMSRKEGVSREKLCISMGGSIISQRKSVERGVNSPPLEKKISQDRDKV